MSPYDRTGDPEPADDTAPEHDPRCRDGWIDRDSDHPRPCLDCKPHLTPDARRRRMYGPHEATHPSTAETHQPATRLSREEQQ